MLPVSYVQLSKLEPLVEAAKKFESALHQKTKEEKSTNWMLKMAKQADIDLGDNFEAKKAKKQKPEVKAPIDIFDSDLNRLHRAMDDENKGAKHKTKALSKVQQLKKKYDDLKKVEQFKKVSNSSFLTPEAASYLNELIKKNQSGAVD